MEDEKILAEDRQEETDASNVASDANPQGNSYEEEQGAGKDEAPTLSEAERLAKERKAKREKWLQPLKYFLCAASAGILQFVSALVIKIVLEKFIDPEVEIHFITNLKETTFIADTVGLGLSIIWNFTLNRNFTFKDAGNVPIAMLLAFLFYVPFYPFQIWYIDTIEKAILASTGGRFDVMPFIIAQGTCMAYNLVLEFLWQKFVVFRKPKSEK